MDANESNLTRFRNRGIEVSGALVELHCVYAVADLLLSSYALGLFG
jgi:hypothetical protein